MGVKIINEKIYFSPAVGLWYIVNTDGSYTSMQNNGEMDFFLLKDTLFQYQTTYSTVIGGVGSEVVSNSFLNYSVNDGQSWMFYKTLSSQLYPVMYIVNNYIIICAGSGFGVYDFKENKLRIINTSGGSGVYFLKEFQGYIYAGGNGVVSRMKSSDFFNTNNWSN